MVSKGAKIGIIVFILVGLSVAIYFAAVEYRKQCPDGLMVCLGLEDGPTKDPAPKTTTPATVPAADRSQDYAECTRYFDEEDKTKTCYDPANGKGGLRWFWSNTAGGKTCLKKTQFYKIEASSAINDHAIKYEFIKPGGSANGFVFENARHLTQKDGKPLNMKFNITPLDKDKKPLADPLMGQELNPGDNTTDCSGIGTTVSDFNAVFNVQSVPSQAPPPPPPQDCVGTMGSMGLCISDTPNPICNVTFGTTKSTFNKTKDPKYGGKACPGGESKKCIVTENCTPYTDADLSSLNLSACSFGSWVTPDDQPTCPTGCTDDDTTEARWGPMIEQERFIQSVILDMNGKLQCNPNQADTRNIRACAAKSNPGARPLCPKNCVGAWSEETVTDVGGTCYGKTSQTANTKKYKIKKHERTWNVAESASRGGTCPFTNGTKKTYYSHHGYVRNGCGAGAAGNCNVPTTCDENYSTIPVYT